MEFIAATNNPGKLAELERILTRMGHTVRSQRAAGIALEPEETGATFDENAAIKARAVCEACGLATIADDSGLCVDALGGEPGVRSARYCGRHGDDEANNDTLLAALAGVPADARAAHFASSVCVWLPDGRHCTWQGVCPGRIGFARAGTNGFGYDPLFIPARVGTGPQTSVLNEKARTYAQLSADEKDAISHRGAALRRMQSQLNDFLHDASVCGGSCTPAADAGEGE